MPARSDFDRTNFARSDPITTIHIEVEVTVVVVVSRYHRMERAMLICCSSSPSAVLQSILRYYSYRSLSSLLSSSSSQQQQQHQCTVMMMMRFDAKFLTTTTTTTTTTSAVATAYTNLSPSPPSSSLPSPSHSSSLSTSLPSSSPSPSSLPSSSLTKKKSSTTMASASASASATSSSSSSPLRSSFADERPIFAPKRVLILTKMTRLEFERRTHATFTEHQLKLALAKRGSDYSRLLERHLEHNAYLKVVEQELRNVGIETRIVERFEYDTDAINWADAIFSAGGDGTFLRAASKITSRNKPLVGVNTDPQSSEGYLCLLKKLPKEHFKGALKKLLDGDFKWLYRQRIRIRLLLGGKDADRIEHIELHDQQLNVTSEHRWHQMLLSQSQSSHSHSDQCNVVDDDDQSQRQSGNETEQQEIILPELALNEVFIGESLSSRVSYYELAIDDNQALKQKSSGVNICTGTGSTSWYFNINKLNEQTVSDLMRIINDDLSTDLPFDSAEIAARICQKFNRNLVFAPDLQKMAFSMRDAINSATFRCPHPRGLAERIRIRSRCYDAHLVIDGGTAYKFNDGAEAILEVHSDDALKTVIFR